MVLVGCAHVSPVSRKVLALLKTALRLRRDELYDVQGRAWTHLLYNLEDATLESLVEEVCGLDSLDLLDS